MRKFQPSSHKGRICIQFSLNGQRYSLYGLGNADSHSDNAKADALCNVIYSDVLEGRFDSTLERYKAGLQRATKSLGTPVEMFARWVEALEVSDKTYRVHYEPVLRAVVATQGKVLSGLNITEHWKDLAPASYNGRIGYLRRWGRWMVDEGYLPLNPYRSLKLKHNDAVKIKPFTAGQVKAVIQHLVGRNEVVGAYYAFLFYTGCRPSEAIGLQWSKIDFDNETITIDSVLARSDEGNAAGSSRVRKPTKTGDTRVLPMSHQIREALNEAWNYQHELNIDSGLVFCSPNNLPLDDTNLCDRYWKPALKACGIPYQRPYVTRHTAASTLIENGYTLADAAKLLGHKDLRMVSTVYGHAIKPLTLPSYGYDASESTSKN